MTVAKVIELSSQSNKSFDDAIKKGIAKAGETVKRIRSAWVENQEVLVNGGKVVGYRVHLRVTFVLKD